MFEDILDAIVGWMMEHEMATIIIVSLLTSLLTNAIFPAKGC